MSRADQEKGIDEDVKKSSHGEGAGISIQPEGQLPEHAQGGGKLTNQPVTNYDAPAAVLSKASQFRWLNQVIPIPASGAHETSMASSMQNEPG